MRSRRKREPPPFRGVPIWARSALALLAFAVIAVVGLWPEAEAANAAILRAVQSAFPMGSADPVGLLLVLGSSQVSLLLIGLLGLWLLRRGERLTAFSLGLILVGVGIEVVLKASLRHPMVWDEFSRGPGLYPFPEIKPTGILTFVSPFPSGHMLRATYLALAFSTVLERRLTRGGKAVLRIAAWALIAAIAFGVLYLGWHWPTDVLGSLALGYGLTVLTRWAADREGQGSQVYRLSRRPAQWGHENRS